MSESRFDRKKTIVCYGIFCAVVLLLASLWYAVDWKNCVRYIAFVIYMCFSVFSIIMSRDSVYLSIYKLALTFYLLGFFLIGSLEVAILFFDRNIWADIITRVILILLITLLIEKKMKGAIKGFGDFVETEADRFSVVTMTICILFGIGFMLNPNLKETTPFRLYQISVNFILTAVLQLLMYRLYLHIGKGKEYERESQLIQMNYRLLERQIELQEEAVENGKRIRHDARHHNAVIAEYVRQGQKEELLQYLREYDKETNQGAGETICANTAVNHILTSYTAKAKKEQIRVSLDIEIGKQPAIPNIDLVAIIANAYENAIYACMEVKKNGDPRECFIHFAMKKRKNKLSIFCSNTCKPETKLKNGQPNTEFTGGIGVSSMIKTAKKYDGEYDFKNDNGVFIFRMILNIPLETGRKNERGGGWKMMIQIALCDDETAELRKIERMLEDYEKAHSVQELAIRCFVHTDELLSEIKTKAYQPDVLFLDIYIPDDHRTAKPLGMEAARTLRGMGGRGRIIFLTSSKEYALEAFDVDARQYLVKPVTKEKLFSLLDSLMAEIGEERKKYVLLRSEGQFMRLPLNDIMCCEAQGKTQRLYLADGTKHTLRLTMIELYKLFSQSEEFVRVGVSYIVNLEYIASLNAKELYMDNGMKIYLPRGAYKGLREQYLDYYCGEKE